MSRKPILCPERGEPCIRPECSLISCVDQNKFEPMRGEARKAHRRKVREGVDIGTMTLDELDALSNLDA